MSPMRCTKSYIAKWLREKSWLQKRVKTTNRIKDCVFSGEDFKAKNKMISSGFMSVSN